MLSWLYQIQTLNQPHVPMQIRLFKHPFHILGVHYVGDLPTSPSGNKWILTTVCHFSNFLHAIPVTDNTATTEARALFNHVFWNSVFLQYFKVTMGFEFLNAVLHRWTKLLTIKQASSSASRPRLDGATERIASLIVPFVIFYEKQQERCEEFL